jgi:hypothetical protein
MRIFSRYKNLSNEKTLVHQLNALNQEMDLLQVQLNKVNQLLNDTIAEKCKQELLHSNNTNSSYNNNSNNHSKTSSNTSKDQSNSLYRASLVPVVGSLNNNNNNEQKSIWKSSSPMQKRNIIQQQNNLDSSNEEYQQIHKPKLKSIHQITAQSSSKMSNNSYLSNPHQYHLNNNINTNKNETTNGSIINLNLMSKSIDSLNMQNNSNNINVNTNSMLTNKLFNGSSNGAFNPTGSSSKKTALLDLNDDKTNEIPISFQPVNFTNSRPKQFNGLQQPSTINISNLVNQQMTSSFVQKGSNFKRDVIAEKKRSSIGKYPNYVVNFVFFLIIFIK